MGWGLTSGSGRIGDIKHWIVNHGASQGRGLSFAGLFQGLVKVDHECLSIEEHHVGSVEDGDNRGILDLSL
jgi:hypothetical protein